MPDIFISYKKEERDIAALLAERLTSAGHDVWWDDSLLAGGRFEDEITAALDASKVVVVLWSKLSVASDWVKAEAESARQQAKALPVITDDLEPLKLPLLFRGMHVVRLAGWRGEADHPGYADLMAAIGERLGRAAGPAVATRPAAGRPTSIRRASALWLGAACVVLGLVAGGGYLAYRQTTATSPADQAAIDRCSTWSLSAKLDARTAFPRLDPTTDDDCSAALARKPDDGNMLGMMAMVRAVEGKLDDAVALAREGADRNGSAAYYALGNLYALGLGVAADRQEATQNYLASTRLGSTHAAGRLCMIGLSNDMHLPVSSTRDEIVGYCKEATDGGDSFGFLATGFAYETGADGRTVDFSKAGQFYQQAASLGSDDGAVRLGSLYERGAGTTQDYARAVQLYQGAADNGWPSGLRALGVSLELGHGIAQDINRAAQLYEKAARLDDLSALLLAGYDVNDGPQPALDDRHDLENLTVDATAPTAQRVLAQLYARGILQPKDGARALATVQPCSDAGNSFCQAMRGYFLQFGVDGNKRPADAVPLFQASADQGNMFGQFMLARVYAQGAGVAKDIDKARRYYSLAAQQGLGLATDALNSLGDQ